MSDEILKVTADELATDSISFSDWFLGAKGSLMYKASVATLSNVIGSNGVLGYRGPLMVASVPAEDGFYFAAENGVYNNAGGVNVDLSQGINVISVIGGQTVFDKVVYPIDLSSLLVQSVTKSDLTHAPSNYAVYRFAAKKDIEKSPSIFVESALLSGSLEFNDILKFGIKDMKISGVVSDKYFYLWSCDIDNVTDDTLVLYFASSNVNTSDSSIGTIALKFQEIGIKTRTGFEWIKSLRYGASEVNQVTVELLVDWDYINSFQVESVVSFHSYQKGGVKPEFYKKSLFSYFDDSSMKKNFFYFDGVEELRIASKYNASLDIVSHWRKCMANELYTFFNVSLKSNFESFVSEDLFRPVVDTILNVSSDYIGPIDILDQGWVGGNHLKNVDGTDYKTAKTISIEIIADGVPIKKACKGYADEIVVNVVNEIYDSSMLPVENVQALEYVSYLVSGKSIDVIVRHKWLKAVTINTYYGFQSLDRDWQDKIYFAHGQDVSIQDKVINMSSGNSDIYDVEKVIISNTAKSICQSMILNTSKGLGLKGDNVDNSFPRAFVSNVGKTYFNLIKNKGIAANESYFWNGVYTWFDNSIGLDSGILYKADYNSKGQKNFFIDAATAGEYVMSSVKIGKELELISKDVSIDYEGLVLPNGVIITTNGYGNIYLKEK